MCDISIGNSSLRKLANLKSYLSILHGESKVPNRMIHSLCSPTVSSPFSIIRWQTAKLEGFLCIYCQIKDSYSYGYWTVSLMPPFRSWKVGDTNWCNKLFGSNLKIKKSTWRMGTILCTPTKSVWLDINARKKKSQAKSSK